MKHPMQPIEIDGEGIARFKRNAIVTFLLDWASPRGIDMNALSIMPFTSEDRSQFAQLIGYSVSGWGGLSYTDPDEAEKADAAVEAMVAKEKKKRA